MRAALIHIMTPYVKLTETLRTSPKTWLVTGGAGFIGSHLIEQLLALDQQVVCLDNFSTGRKVNLSDVQQNVSAAQWKRFSLIEGDICNPAACNDACRGVDYILHQAALGSVPRSISNPVATNHTNVSGFVTVLSAAKDAGVRRFVYASSSAVYGDHPGLPKVEDKIGNSLSPYAASKRANELYADAFARCYSLPSIGLRYFNVFGARQDPNGPYAAVIPGWIAAMLANRPFYINGDGETSRDFCCVANVVQANLLAASVMDSQAINQVYNIAVGQRTTLNELFEMLRRRLTSHCPHLKHLQREYRDFRTGDVRHSHADITRANRLLGYKPTHDIERGLDESLRWYVSDTRKSSLSEVRNTELVPDR